MPSPYGRHRLLEIIPGALIWSTLAGAVALSFLVPTLAMIFIIVFDLYWLFRVIYFVSYLIFSWRAYKREARVDWMSEVHKLADWRRVHHLIFCRLTKRVMKFCAGRSSPYRDRLIPLIE